MSDDRQLLGTWRLISFVTRDADGNETADFGPTPRGCLMYDHSGRVSVHLAHSDIAEDVYFSYFGTFSVDANAGTITHHVEGSSEHQFAGTDQVRFFTLQGNRLVLSTPPGRDVTYVATWER